MRVALFRHFGRCHKSATIGRPTKLRSRNRNVTALRVRTPCVGRHTPKRQQQRDDKQRSDEPHTAEKWTNMHKSSQKYVYKSRARARARTPRNDKYWTKLKKKGWNAVRREAGKHLTHTHTHTGAHRHAHTHTAWCGCEYGAHSVE